jgi:hypothetical protein
MTSTVKGTPFKKKVLNHGNKPLFQLFAMALCDISTVNLSPEYINIISSTDGFKNTQSLLITGGSFVTKTLQMGTESGGKPLAIISTNINGSNVDKVEANNAHSNSNVKVRVTLETRNRDILAYVELGADDIENLTTYSYGTQLIISWELGIDNPTNSTT